MDRSTRDSDRTSLQASDSCRSCGGSGVLRTNGVSYRTCLDCLGQGVPPSFTGPDLSGSGFTLPGCLESTDGMARRRRRSGFRGDLSAWTSVAR